MKDTIELLESRKELLETEIQKLKEIQQNLEPEITRFNFVDIGDSIENTLSEKLWWLDTIEQDIQVEVALRN